VKVRERKNKNKMMMKQFVSVLLIWFSIFSDLSSSSNCDAFLISKNRLSTSPFMDLTRNVKSLIKRIDQRKHDYALNRPQFKLNMCVGTEGNPNPNPNPNVNPLKELEKLTV
jgi:hypothetical protein